MRATETAVPSALMAEMRAKLVALKSLSQNAEDFHRERLMEFHLLTEMQAKNVQGWELDAWRWLAICAAYDWTR